MATEIQLKYLTIVNELKSTIGSSDNLLLNKLSEIIELNNGLVDELKKLQNLQPSDVGLKFVPNWNPSTTEDAIKGDKATGFISPRRLDDYMESNLYAPLTTILNNATNALNAI